LGFWCNVERSEDDERKREKWGILADFKSCITLTPHQTRKDRTYLVAFEKLGVFMDRCKSFNLILALDPISAAY
jgi:hypothetical protein